MTGERRSAGPPVRSRLSAFGLSIASEVEILGADGEGAADLPAADLPAVDLRLADPTTPPPSVAPGETVLERRWEDDSLGMRVWRLADDAFAVEAPGHGRFHIAPDGRRVTLADLQGPPERWHRPLLGQVLPLASTLRGHETLHASAAVLDGGAVAVSAPSNTGKSSLMINLVDRGAGLLTDDVLALTLRNGRLIAHPGSPLANLSAAQHALLSPGTRDRLGAPVGETDKQTFAVAGLRGAGAPLRALITLRRSERLSRLTMRRVSEPAPARLLATTFLPHIATTARMLQQLDVCAVLARTVLVFELDAPASVPASELARVVEAAVRAPAESAEAPSADAASGGDQLKT